MKRTAMFLMIIALSGIISHSATVAFFTSSGIAISACLAVAIGGIIDAIVLFAGGQPAMADKVISLIFGKKQRNEG